MTWAFDLRKKSFKFEACWKMKALSRCLNKDLNNFLFFASFTMSSKVRNSTWPSHDGLWTQETLVGKSWPNKKKRTSNKMHPHWENNKARETTVSTHIWNILLLLESKSFFQAQTHFSLNLLFHHNLNVVSFPYM